MSSVLSTELRLLPSQSQICSRNSVMQCWESTTTAIVTAVSTLTPTGAPEVPVSFPCWGTGPQVWPWSCTRAIGGSSPLPSPLECVLHPPSLLPETAPRVQPWDTMCVILSGLGTWQSAGQASWVCDRTQLRSLCKLNIWSTESYSHLVDAQDKPSK